MSYKQAITFNLVCSKELSVICNRVQSMYVNWFIPLYQCMLTADFINMCTVNFIDFELHSRDSVDLNSHWVYLTASLDIAYNMCHMPSVIDDSQYICYKSTTML